jgi:hypothetical protein
MFTIMCEYISFIAQHLVHLKGLHYNILNFTLLACKSKSVHSYAINQLLFSCKSYVINVSISCIAFIFH